MKILYAFQGTGNGHVSRARELVPLLEQHAEVDILVSGTHSEVGLGRPILIKRHGMGFQFGKNGGVDLWSSIKKFRPLRFIRDVRDLPLHPYDLILNDFEPVSAYAAKRIGREVHAISHQAAFLSDQSPRPQHIRSPFAEWLFRNYAPSSSQTAFHFQAYDTFIHTPVIRSEVRALRPAKNGHITVYLPAYGDKQLVKHFQKLKAMEWHLFSKHYNEPTKVQNVWIRPVNNQAFLESLHTANGLLTGGGFESPAEALFLGKKLFVVPMHNQFEQQCNAAALKQMGIPVTLKITSRFAEHLQAWLHESHETRVHFPDNSHDIIQNIVNS